MTHYNRNTPNEHPLREGPASGAAGAILRPRVPTPPRAAGPIGPRRVFSGGLRAAAERLRPLPECRADAAADIAGRNMSADMLLEKTCHVGRVLGGIRPKHRQGRYQRLAFDHYCVERMLRLTLRLQVSGTAAADSRGRHLTTI